MKRRSAAARSLESPLFRQKVIDMRKKQRKAAEKQAAEQMKEARSARRP